MEIRRGAIAGTLESSDIMITIEPASNGITIHLNSVVEQQFGRQIRRVIADTLQALDVESAKVTAVDRGALDCVIRARLKAAVYRACDDQEIQEVVR